MAKYVSGKRGYIKWSLYSGTPAEKAVTGWSATIETEALETSNTGDAGFRSYISGVTGGSGVINMCFDVNDPIASQISGLAVGSAISLELYVGHPTIDSKKISGLGMVESIAYDSKVVGSPVTLTINFKFSGTITPV